MINKNGHEYLRWASRINIPTKGDQWAFVLYLGYRLIMNHCT